MVLKLHKVNYHRNNDCITKNCVCIHLVVLILTFREARVKVKRRRHIDLFGVADPEGEMMELDKFPSCMLKEHRKKR